MGLVRILSLLVLLMAGYVWYANPTAEKELARLTAPNPICGNIAQPCSIDGGAYHILVPHGTGPFPAVIFFHGSGSTGAHIINSRKVATALLQKGYALIAPNALDVTYINGERKTGWNWDGERNDRDDYRFAKDVIGDALTKFPVDAEKVVVAGHSNGATFVWYLACTGIDDRLRHFAPVGGTPQRGHLGGCAETQSDFHLFHTHGQNDKIVPLQGSRPTTWSGWLGVLEAIKLLDVTTLCTGVSEGQSPGIVRSVRWDQCQSGTEFRLDIAEGGHTVPPQWVDAMVRWHNRLQ